MAGNLGVFYAKVRAEHWKTGEEVESKSMVYVIEGNIVLVSRAVEDAWLHSKTLPEGCRVSRT